MASRSTAYNFIRGESSQQVISSHIPWQSGVTERVICSQGQGEIYPGKESPGQQHLQKHLEQNIQVKIQNIDSTFSFILFSL